MNSQAADAAPIRLGTRRSHLAMTQSTWVAEQLRAHGHAVDRAGARGYRAVTHENPE